MTVTIESWNAATMSSCRNTGAIEGGIEKTPLNSVLPENQPMIATINMPMITAPRILRAESAAIVTNPMMQAIDSKLAMSPSATRVTS